MLTMTPPLLAAISRAAACATRNAALTLSPSSRSSVASSTSRKGCGLLIPALLTRMSRRSRPAKAARIAAASVTSKGNDRALPPAVVISRTTSSSSLGVRLTSTSSAPAAASANAAARPMPRPAPVTSAVLPSRRKALSAEVTGIAFEQAPRLRPGLFPPSRVEVAEPLPKARGVGRVDLHAPARQLVGPVGVDPLDIRALQQGEFLGVALDDLLDGARQG